MPFKLKNKLLKSILIVLTLVLLTIGALYSYYQNSVIPDQIKANLNENIAIINKSSKYSAQVFEKSSDNLVKISNRSVDENKQSEFLNSFEEALNHLDQNITNLQELLSKVKNAPDNLLASQYNIASELINERKVKALKIYKINQYWFCLSNFGHNFDKKIDTFVNKNVEIKKENANIFRQDADLLQSIKENEYKSFKICNQKHMSVISGALNSKTLSALETDEKTLTNLQKALTELSTGVENDDLSIIINSQKNIKESGTANEFLIYNALIETFDETKREVEKYSKDDIVKLELFKSVSKEIGSKYNLQLEN